MNRSDSMSETVVAESLTRTFGQFVAVDSVDFQIPQGQVVGFLGPNGAGKTTTIRMMAGYLPPSSGTVRICGLDVRSQHLEVRQKIGYLPEAAPVYGEMRVCEFLAFRSRLFGLSRNQARLAMDRALERCELTEVRRRPIQHLSRGYRQRVGLAAAILHDPEVLILDEPTVGLDPGQILTFRRLLRELSGSRTVLLSTHILPEVEQTCDRLIMIARGRIRAQGTIDEIRAQDAKLSRYIVETTAPTAIDAIKQIDAVVGVDRVPLEGSWQRLTVTAPTTAGDLREAVAGRVGSQGTIRELRKQEPTLEHLFVQMVAEAEADFAARDAEPVVAGASQG